MSSVNQKKNWNFENWYIQFVQTLRNFTQFFNVDIWVGKKMIFVMKNEQFQKVV